MKRGLKRKKVNSILLAIFLVGGLTFIGCSSEGVDNNKKSEATEETKDTYAINEEAKIKDVSVTVTNVEKSAGSDYDKPKDGMEYVIVTVKIKNLGKDKISYNPFDYKMKNSQGQITTQAFTIVDSDSTLSSGELSEGGEISGTIAFEQPKDDAGLELQYTENMFTDKVIKFKLN